jgi:hypothetical protein
VRILHLFRVFVIVVHVVVSEFVFVLTCADDFLVHRVLQLVIAIRHGVLLVWRAATLRANEVSR